MRDFPLLRSSLFVLGTISALYLVTMSLIAAHVLRSPENTRKVLDGDSQQYFDIAQDFAKGDFNMSYLERWPHREPLYPLALAAPLKIADGNLGGLLAVNIVVGLLLVIAVYLGTLKFFGDPIVAALVAFCVPINRFLLTSVPRHLVTEPLFVLLVFLAILGFLAYLRGKSVRGLVVSSATCGLAYLTRPNGLFVMAAMLVTLLARDSYEFFRKEGNQIASRLKRARRLSLVYGLTIAVFVFITAPSWWPRWQHLGNPISHGYLSNFVFADTYTEVVDTYSFEGQTPKHGPYHLSDYLQAHSIFDFLKRWLLGFWQVYIRIPLWNEVWPILYAIGAIGLFIGIKDPPSEYRWLGLWMFVQLLPLVWTNLSNPTGRIPYAAMLPFMFIFAAVGFVWIKHRRVDKRKSSPPETE